MIIKLLPQILDNLITRFRHQNHTNFHSKHSQNINHRTQNNNSHKPRNVSLHNITVNRTFTQKRINQINRSPNRHTRKNAGNFSLIIQKIFKQPRHRLKIRLFYQLFILFKTIHTSPFNNLRCPFGDAMSTLRYRSSPSGTASQGFPALTIYIPSNQINIFLTFSSSKSIL